MGKSLWNKLAIGAVALAGTGIGLSVINDNITPRLASELNGLVPADPENPPSVELGISGIYNDGTVLIVNRGTPFIPVGAQDTAAFIGPVKSHIMLKPNGDVISTGALLGNLFPRTYSGPDAQEVQKSWSPEIEKLCMAYSKIAGVNYVEKAYDRDIASGAAPANFFGGHSVRDIPNSEIEAHVSATTPSGIKRTCDFT